MKQLKKVGLPVLSILLICFYPCAFMFFQNAGEARAVDMLPFFGIFLFTAAVGGLIALLLLRNVAQAAILVDLGMLVVMHFTLICNGIKKLLPGFHNIIFLVFVGLVLLALLVLFRRKKPNMVIPCGVLALVFGCMTAVNLFMALPTLISIATYQRPQAPLDDQLDTLVFDNADRNVYYLLFDEYGGSENLLHYYNYDNEEFLAGLEDRGFSVSRTSRNTESCWTVTLIPNMLNLDYVTDDSMPIQNRLEWLDDPVLFRLFRENGYQVNLINQNGFLNDAGCHLLSKPQYDETISDYLYENSIFCQIPKLNGEIERVVLHRSDNGPMEALTDVRQNLMDCWEFAQNGPTLTIGYFVSPHAPFLFDEAGNATTLDEYYDWRIPELYLAKLEYTNEMILEAVDIIQEKDPDAIILLQSDHGARTPGQLVNEFGGPWFDTEAEIPYMQSVLCCAYVPGSSLSVEGDTCVNATRKILSSVFGLTLPPLEAPESYTIPPEYMPPPPEEGSGSTPSREPESSRTPQPNSTSA